MKSVLQAICLLFCLCAAGFAQGPRPQDFARGMTLETNGSGPFYSLALPAWVYKETVRSDIGDIRIFNSSDEMLPHVIKQPESIAKPVHPPAILPFFPVFADQKKSGTSAGEKVSLQIKTAEDGTIINVQAGGKQPSRPNPLQTVLLDLSHLQPRPAELEMEWDNKGENFVTSVSVDGSQTLTQWTPLVQGAGLAEQHFSGHTLYKNRVSLPERDFPANYLRINWPDQAPKIKLTMVTAIFPDTQTGPKRNWRQLQGERIPDADTETFRFDAKGAFPVDRVNIRPAETNSLIRAEIQSRQDKGAKWRLRHRGLFYHLSVDKTVISNENFLIPVVNDRYWRIETTSGSGVTSDRPPLLELGWIPHRLVFLARGEAPFTLACGSARFGPGDGAVENVLQDIHEEKQAALLSKASAGRRFVLGGHEALEKRGLPHSWKTWVLWGALAAGVALLGFMAYRLYGRMNGVDRADSQAGADTRRAKNTKTTNH